MPSGHGSGGGHWGKTSPAPPFCRTKGWWGGRRRFTPFIGSWGFAVPLETPICASPLFPLAPNCSSGYSGAPAYPSSPAWNAGAAAPTVLPSALPISTVPPVYEAFHPPQPSPVSTVTTSSAAPPRAPVAEDERPTLVVLRTGGMYSITRHWTKGKDLYFETTSGDTLYTPLALLLRLIPGR